MKNLNAPHISDTERQVILAVFDQLLTLLTPKFCQLSAEERQRYGSVNEQNKLLINKVFEFKRSQPNLSAPEIDWNKFEADHNDRGFLSQIIMITESILYDIQSTKMAHDNDNYNAARMDYAYSEYRAKNDILGSLQKYNELKQFFSRTTPKKEDEGNNNVTPPTTPPA